MANIFEQFILSRLRAELDSLKIILSERFGFRVGHSTEFQLLRATQTIGYGFETRETTSAVFLDIDGAFDPVWHDGLVLKMTRLGINPTIVRQIKSYLDGRTFQVRVDRAFSQTRNIAVGVAQDSILGPELFLVCHLDMLWEPGRVLAEMTPPYSRRAGTRGLRSVDSRSLLSTGSGGGTSALMCLSLTIASA